MKQQLKNDNFVVKNMIMPLVFEIVSLGILVLIVVISGIILGRQSRIYSRRVLRIHVLFTVILAIWSVWTIFLKARLVDYGVAGLVMLVIASVTLAVALLSGLIAYKKQKLEPPLILHKIFSYLMLFFMAHSLYYLLFAADKVP